MVVSSRWVRELNNPIHSLTCSSYYPGACVSEICTAERLTIRTSRRERRRPARATPPTANLLPDCLSLWCPSIVGIDQANGWTGLVTWQSATPPPPTFAFKKENPVKGGKIITVNIFRFIKIWLFCTLQTRGTEDAPHTPRWNRWHMAISRGWLGWPARSGRRGRFGWRSYLKSWLSARKVCDYATIGGFLLREDLFFTKRGRLLMLFKLKR